MTLKIDLLVGDDVFKHLSNEDLILGWDILYRSCPWGTVFQSREYVTSWYQVYSEKYLPILVKGVDGNQLNSMIALARDKDGIITGAGANQAEYQVWLAPASDESSFIKKALAQVLKQFPKDTIRLKYVPEKAPVGWIKTDPFWKKRCSTRTVQQPLIILDEAKLDTELRKKNRREKINRLKRQGILKFEHVTDVKEFSSLFDELAIQYDFRKEAMFNLNFFKSDPLRKVFLLKLFEQQLLHVTVLRLDNAIIASNVGAKGKKWVHLQGINTHDPSYAKYSPGILHFLMLGKQLAEEGMEVFDLTPGADTYKAGLATDYTQANQLYIGNNLSRVAVDLKLRLTNNIKKVAPGLGIKEGDLRKYKKRAETLKDVFRHNLNQLFSSTFLRRKTAANSSFFKIDREEAVFPLSDYIKLNRCSLKDLLDYDASGGRQSRWRFLEKAMQRLENGDRCYTWSEEGRLLACVWLSNQAKAAAVGEEGAAVLYGLYVHPAGRDKLKEFIGAVVAQAAREDGKIPVYALASASADDHKALEISG